MRVNSRQSTIFKFYQLEDFMRNYFEKTYLDGFDSYTKKLTLCLEKEQKKFLVTANPETFMIAEKNSRFKQVLDDPRVEIVPDGIGVVKAGNLLGYPIKERVTGVEICQHLLKQAELMKKSIYLFGAKPEVIEALIKKISQDYPNIRITGYKDGYVSNKEEVFDEIAAEQPDIVLVALGIPQQEILIYKNYERFAKGIFVGVGGSFDVLSGMKKRAPEFFVKCNLEWLYRIVKEPKRMKRFFVSNIKFIIEVLKLAKKGKKNEN